MTIAGIYTQSISSTSGALRVCTSLRLVWDDVLRVLGTLRPERIFDGEVESEDRDLSTVAGHARAVEILRSRFEMEGFVGLEEAVVGCIEHLE